MLTMGLLPQEIGPVVYLGHTGHKGGECLQTATETERLQVLAAGGIAEVAPPPTDVASGNRSPPAEEDALTRDGGPRRLRHDLQNSSRNLRALAGAMASGHTGNGSTRACDPQPKQLRASSVELRPGRYQLRKRGSIC